jgi:hypothetical protein
MALIYNGIICNTIEELETQIASLTEQQKNYIRNDFNGVQNSTNSILQPVTNQQLRQALILMSIQMNNSSIHPTAISSFLETLPEPNKSLAKNYWEYSNEMQRDNALVQSLGPSLGLSSTDLDNIWAYARTLK